MQLELLALPIAVIVAIAGYLAAMLILPKQFIQKDTVFIKNTLEKLEDQNAGAQEGERSIEKRYNVSDGLLVRAFVFLPGSDKLLPAIDRAGMVNQIDKLMAISLGILIALLLLTAGMGIGGFLISAVGTFAAMYYYLKRAANKRSTEFLDSFPDALDVISRSIRAGYPVTAAIGMVSDTMSSWVGTEFQRIVDETSYGVPLNEAVMRFAQRIGNADAQFFAVVLGVQQESGGNLTEVLGNLSRIIRERKKLRLKIKALSSEGRATALILGILPFFMVGAVHFTSPEHLTPLWTTTPGNMVVMIVVGCLISGVVIIKKIINIDI